MLTRPVRIEDPARRHGYALAVVLILLVSTALRLWQLGTPDEMMFDEIYYAKDAKAIVDGRVGTDGQYRWAAGDEVSWPHPEMGKFAIATGILAFGDRSFGWRLPAVAAGIGILLCVYPLARRLGLSPPWALLALALAAADPLGITQSRIATLDVFIALWTVLCVLLALRYVQDEWHPGPLFACGAAGGMAVATKWSGGLALVAAALIVAVAWVLQTRARHAAQKAAASEDPASRTPALAPRLVPPRAETEAAEPPAGSVPVRIAAVLLALVALPAAIYLLSYAQYFIAGHSVADFRELHRQMVIFNLHLEATHSYASLAPTWIVDYRPVWYYFEGTETYHGVIAIGNPFLWWLATGAVLAAIVLAVLRRSYVLLPAAALVVVLYAPWFLATRTSFLYYMTPVAPVMAVLVAAALCLFAGGVVPSRGWLVAAAAAGVAAVLWRPIGVGATWLFWDLPRRGGDALGWLGVAVGITLGVAVVLLVFSRRLRPYRPWTAMAIAGATIGIVVAFVPIVLGLPISPRYFEQIMWFPSWI